MTASGGAGLKRAGFVLGMALSGFADGILLHQVLQWHHFLSLARGETFRDLRVQVFADGLFHVFVYLVTATGLWLLWRARARLDQAGSGRELAGSLLLGFGVWNIIDVGFFHWVLGIHRIRVNVPNPMLYDLAWFLGLGVVVALAGWLVLRRRGGGSGGSLGRPAAVAALLALVSAAPIANLPPRDGSTLILFRPGTTVGAAFNAVLDARGQIVAMDPQGSFAVVRLPTEASSLSLYRAGALLVTRSPLLAGCLAFTGGSAPPALI